MMKMMKSGNVKWWNVMLTKYNVDVKVDVLNLEWGNVIDDPDSVCKGIGLLVR